MVFYRHDVFEPEKNLVARMQRGERVAIGDFFDRFERLFYAALRRNRMVAPQDVDDLYNDFFLHLADQNFRRIALWNGEAALSTYLVTLLGNFVRDYYRSKRIRPSGLEELNPDEGYDEYSEQVPVERVLGAKQLREHLKSAKQTLEERDRRLICLRLFRDLDPQACAEELGLTPGAFYTAYHRAEQRLTRAFRRLNPLLFSEGV